MNTLYIAGTICLFWHGVDGEKNNDHENLDSIFVCACAKTIFYRVVNVNASVSQWKTEKKLGLGK